MAENRIQHQLKPIIDRFTNQSSRDESRAIIREAQQAVRAFFANELKVSGSSSVEAEAARNPATMRRITQDHFGFNVYEQPSYSSVDDYAWASSQRYTTLDDVTLPANARFFDSKRKPLTQEEVETRMADGEHHLFDIALSNEFVLLGANEKFSVNDLETRFSTNNEHLVPQSKSRTEGGTRVFKADPRVIVISDTKNNGARGNLQVVFLDNQGNVRDSISLISDEEHEKPVLVRRDLSKNPALSAARAQRFPIGPEDAPHYAYALGLAYFASGMNPQDEQAWFDRSQAQEVASMLKKLSASPVELNKEPVLRDLLSDAKVLGGRINPVALLPEAYADALQAEINQNKFRAHLRFAKPVASHVDTLLQERRERNPAELCL